MTRREITSLALKLLAIYLLVQIILAIPNLFPLYSMGREVYETNYSALALYGAAVAAIVIGLAAAFLIWQLANRAMERTTHEAEDKTLSGLEPAILAALGLFLLIDAIVSFSYLSSSAYMQYMGSEPSEIALQTKAQLSAYGLQVVIGISLILRSEGWERLLRNARTAGLSK